MKVKQRLTAVIFLVLAFVSLTLRFNSLGNRHVAEGAQKRKDSVELFNAKRFLASNVLDLGYRFLAPEVLKEGETYPLVLFLHGAGERGDDNEKQLIHVVQELAKSPMREQHPCFVVAPQCPADNRWVEVDWSEDEHEMPVQTSRPLKATLELLEELQQEFPIDPKRIYICGLSMGGFGTWDAIQRHPKKFAAAIPICGGGDPAHADKIDQIPIWVFHGDEDGAVKVKRSRTMVDALRQQGSDVIYTEYPGVGHNCWAQTAENRLVWDWLFAQSRGEN